ncbi:MAG: restriction endonuclease subunit S [Clostridium sp.]|nr:restriction endonuclease subunit S [Clostridium sp.]SFU31857.1 type I restriction enzyme, S subunit [Clostridium sp. DSM 8431]
MKDERRVPRRRFREFLNDGEWEQHKLRDVLSLLKDGTHGTYKDVRNGVYLLSAKNIKNGCVNIDESDRKISFKDYERIHTNFKLKVGDILMTIVGTIGDTAILSRIDKLTFQRSVAFLRPTRELNNIFLKYTIETKYFQKELDNRKTISAQPGIYLGEIEQIGVKITGKINEQQKIGEYFNSLDRIINLNQHKLEKLKALKKAYLTQMFPSDGECKPKLRFAGFNEEWKDYKVKDICGISTGMSNTQDKIVDGMYPFYVRSPIIERSNKYLYDEEAVLTVGDGVGTGKVFHYVNGKYDLHQRVYRMFGFDKGVLGRYFYHYFSNHFYDRVMAMTAKTSVDSVRLEMISDMNIIAPSIEEQNKIANFLDRLNNFIDIQQRKIEKLQAIKKSYLNEMFI